MKWKVILPFIFFSTIISGTEIHFEKSTTVCSFLKIGIGPRAQAMGGAFTAISGDGECLSFNPAGLATLKSISFYGVHNAWYSNINHEFTGYNQPIGNGIISGGMNFLEVGNIEKRDVYGNLIGKQTASSFALLLSHSRKESEKIQTGVTFKILRENLPDMGATGVSCDLGLIYQTPFDGLKFGLCVKEFGPKMGFNEKMYELPTSIRTGMAYEPFKNAIVTADVVIPEKGHNKFLFGGEYLFLNTLAVRGGYRYKKDAIEGDPQLGYTAGFGIRRKGLNINYATISHQDFGNSHQVGVAIEFGLKSPSRTDKKSTSNGPHPNTLQQKLEISGDGLFVTRHPPRTDSVVDVPFHSSSIFHIYLNAQLVSNVHAGLILVAETPSYCTRYQTSTSVRNKVFLKGNKDLEKFLGFKSNCSLLVGDLGRVSFGQGLTLDQTEGAGVTVSFSTSVFDVKFTNLAAGLTQYEDTYLYSVKIFRKILGFNLIDNRYVEEIQFLPERQLIKTIDVGIPFLKYFKIFCEGAQLTDYLREDTPTAYPKEGKERKDRPYLLGGSFNYKDEVSLVIDYREYEEDFNRSLAGNLAKPYFSLEAEDKKFNLWRNYLLSYGEVKGVGIAFDLKRRIVGPLFFISKIEKVNIIRGSHTDKFLFFENGIEIGNDNFSAQLFASNKIMNESSDDYTFEETKKILVVGMLKFKFNQ